MDEDRDMSVELIDCRTKITPLADAVIEARSRATGRDRSEIIREVLDAWAANEVHEANVLAALLRAKGLAGSVAGIAGNPRESQGSTGNLAGRVPR